MLSRVLAASRRALSQTLHFPPRQYSSVPFTADTYAHKISRDERYKTLCDLDIAHFREILPASSVLTNPDDLLAYNEDWMRKYRGKSTLVLKPKTTSQVSAILAYCNDQNLAVCPQGGNTGLVGGLNPIFDEIVLSLSSMNKIRSFDPDSGILKCDGGLVLEAADQYLAERHHIFPLDLGAKGSCHVAGTVATNAGGLRLLRYGSLHGLVLGLEAVLPNGTVYSSMDALRKDNTGYDLKQLFIGSEGTLGVITGVSILCPGRPNAVNVALLAVLSYDKVLQVFQDARRDLAEILLAFEFMDASSQAITSSYLKSAHPIESGEYPFYILIETSGSNKEHDDEKLEQFLGTSMENGLVDDGIMAQDELQLVGLWRWRELIPEASASHGGVYKYDVSLPLRHLHGLVDAVNERLANAGIASTTDASKPVVSAIGYGHIGDGNLHLNVCVRQYSPQVEELLEPFVYEWISQQHGSVSAEHGLGFQKKPYVGYSKSEIEIDMMRDLKQLYDPNGIMNPYKYI